MTPQQHLAALRTEGDRLGALDAGLLELPVPTCPGWTVERLIGHTARVHRWVTEVVRLAPTDADRAMSAGRDLPRVPAGPAALEFYRDGLEALIEQLAAADPDQPCWTFMGAGHQRFWHRRQAHETAVHRWDGEAAAAAGAGLTPPWAVDRDLAADGIDEFLTAFLGRFLPPPDDGIERTLHIHGTDDPGPADGAEWLVRLTAGGPVVTAEHAKGDVALRGSANDLLLVLWRRLPLTTIDVIGDAPVAERILDQTRAT